MWFVYILEADNGCLYTGITNNINRRMKQHKSGRGARFTRIFGFKKLRFTEPQKTRVKAMKREAEIKRWPRKKKIMLIRGKSQE